MVQYMSESKAIAGTIIRLLEHQPLPLEHSQALPTPATLVWTAIQEAVCIASQAFVLSCFVPTSVEQPAEPDPSSGAPYTLQPLTVELQEIMYHLLAGHLPNLSLDVSYPIRSVSPHVKSI